jgi:hypothetical protein
VACHWLGKGMIAGALGLEDSTHPTTFVYCSRFGFTPKLLMAMAHYCPTRGCI